jgi:hypothetical protein
MATYIRKNIPPHTENTEQSNNTTILHFMIYIPYKKNLLYLKQNKENFSNLFLFLISKYMKRLKKLANIKQSSKKIYQQACKHYEHQAVRVSHNVHQLLKDVSEMTGYSISHIIRLLIEWECYRRFDEKVWLLRTPLREIDDHFVTTITEVRINHIFYRARELVNEEISILCAG